MNNVRGRDGALRLTKSQNMIFCRPQITPNMEHAKAVNESSITVLRIWQVTELQN